MKLFIRLLTFSLFCLSCLTQCSDLIEEREPNNSLQEAQSIDVPSSIQGRLENGLDQDFYRFDVKEADYYSFSISQVKGFDIMIQVLDEKGNTLKTADDYYKNFGESIANLYLTPGSYFVRVTVGQNDVKIGRPVVIASDLYTLKVTYLSKVLKRKTEILEKEPNDDFKQAQEIKPDSTLTGLFSPTLNYMPRNEKLVKILNTVREKTNKNFLDKDVDIYYFSIPEKGSYLLQLDLSAVKDYDSVVTIMDQKYIENLNANNEEGGRDKGSLLVIDSNSYDKGEGISNYKLKGNTRYFIIISAMSRLDYKTLETLLENPYQLFFKVLPLTSDIEIEPNDSFDQAQIIANNVTRGFLNSVSDRDFYVLEGDEESFYRLDFKETSRSNQVRDIYKPLNITLICPENLDLALEVYDENMKLLKTIDNNGKGGIEKINNLMVSIGSKTYFVVRGGKKNEEGNYKTPYELKVFFANREGENEEFEVNDEIAQNQGPNTFSDSIKGYIGNKGDVDNFYSKLESAKYNIVVKAIPDTSLAIEIYDSNGYFIQKSVSPSKGQDIAFEFHAPKYEVYRIRISSSDKDFFNTETPYTLYINKAGD